MVLNAINSTAFLNVQSQFSKKLLSQSSNLGYFARGAYRNLVSTPDDRKADYWFRDFMMIMAMTVYTELGFRAAEYFYGHPQFTKILGLHRLAYDYKRQSPETPIRNYRSVDEIPALRKRIYGTMVSGDANQMIPYLLRHRDKIGSDAQSRLLIRHLTTRLDFPRYLNGIVAENPASKPQVEKAQQLLADYKAHFARLDPFVHFEHRMKTWLLKGNAPERLQDWQQAFHTVLQQAEHQGSAEAIAPLKAFKTQFMENPEAARFFIEGLQSKLTGKLIKEVQRALLIPQISINFVATLLFFGVLGNQFDFHILQPWEKKISHQGYSSSIIVKPSLLSFLPTSAVFMGTSLLPWVKKKGYFPGFAITSLATLATYFGSTFLMTMWRLKHTQPKPETPQDIPALNADPSRQKRLNSFHAEG